MATETQPLKIAVLLENVQLSDIAPIDIIGNLSRSYLTVAAREFGVDLTAFATDIAFHYLSSTMEPAFMTPSLLAVPTSTYDEAPRDFDIIFIGGPPASSRPPAAAKFLAEAVPHARHVITTCVGSLWLASAGVLEGKKATTNRGALPMARQMYPGTEWLDRRWVVDGEGKFWTSGGASAGVDMVGMFVRERFHPRVVGFALESLDVDPEIRGQFYNKENAAAPQM